MTTSFQPRKPAGSPQGGQFDSKPHTAVSVNVDKPHTTEIDPYEYQSDDLTGMDFDGLSQDELSLCESTISHMTISNSFIDELDLTYTEGEKATISNHTGQAVRLNYAGLQDFTIENAANSSLFFTDSDTAFTTIDKSKLAVLDTTRARMPRSTIRDTRIDVIRADSTSLYGSLITNVTTRDARLRHSDMSMASIKQSNFAGSDFQGVNWDRGEVIRSNMEGAKLCGSTLTSFHFVETNARDVDMRLCDTRFLTCTDSDMAGSKWDGAHLGEMRAERTDFTGADFSGATFDYAQFSRCTLSADQRERLENEPTVELRDCTWV